MVLPKQVQSESLEAVQTPRTKRRPRTAKLDLPSLVYRHRFAKKHGQSSSSRLDDNASGSGSDNEDDEDHEEGSAASDSEEEEQNAQFPSLAKAAAFFFILGAAAHKHRTTTTRQIPAEANTHVADWERANSPGWKDSKLTKDPRLPDDEEPEPE